MTHRPVFLSKPWTFPGVKLSGISIEAYAWQTRVVGRNSTGVPYFSEYANAS